MNSFEVLERIGSESSMTGMERKISEEIDAAALAPPAPPPAQKRPRALVSLPKFTDKESEELEKDGFKVVKSRKERAATPTPIDAPKPVETVVPESNRRRNVFWALSAAAVASIVLICGKALRN